MKFTRAGRIDGRTVRTKRSAVRRYQRTESQALRDRETWQYIAHNPGCKQVEIAKAFGLISTLSQPILPTIKFLLKAKAIWRHHSRYYITMTPAWEEALGYSLMLVSVK